MKYTLLVLSFLLTGVINSRGQIITTIAGVGPGPSSGDGGLATLAHVNGPTGNVFDGVGNLFFNNAITSPKIRMIDQSGIIHTVAGTGVSGFSGDGGLATAAKIAYPSIAVDSIGNLFIADRYNYRIRKVDAITHIISTIAGIGMAGYSGDGGAATAARIEPYGLCVDKAGNLYCVDSAVMIRKITPSGIITTIAGTRVGGFGGDSGPATSAILEMNGSLCLDASNTSLYVECNTRIRKLDLSTGIITTYAGNGGYAYSGDEIPATTAQFAIVFGICIDVNNNLYFADYANQRIRKIDPLGIIHTEAGIGTAGFSGDGFAATSAQIYNPGGVALDACGNLYISDGANNRIRKVTEPPILTVPTISLSGVITAPAGSTVTVTATVAKAGSSYIIHWLNKGVEFTTTTVPSVTYTKGAGIDTITARVVSTATYGCYDSATSGQHIIKIPVVGVQQLAAATELSVYPNPVGDVIHIEGLQSAAVYCLTDIVGRIVLQGAVDNTKNAVDVKNVAKSVYLLELSDQSTGLRMTKKIVKE